MVRAVRERRRAVDLGPLVLGAADGHPVLDRLDQHPHAFADALEFLHAQLSLAFSTDDIQEGVKAFFEKRDPVWSGR